MVHQLLVLIVGEVVVDHHVQHGPRVGEGDLGLLVVCRVDVEVFWETGGENAPNAVRVQLQRASERWG